MKYGSLLFSALIGALAMGAGGLWGDKMKTAPDRTVALGLIARAMSAGIAGAALSTGWIRAIEREYCTGRTAALSIR